MSTTDLRPGMLVLAITARGIEEGRLVQCYQFWGGTAMTMWRVSIAGFPVWVPEERVL